jgi:hypothetical protein
MCPVLIMAEKSADDFVVPKEGPHHSSIHYDELLCRNSRSKNGSTERRVDFSCLRAMLLSGNVNANELLNVMKRCIQRGVSV